MPMVVYIVGVLFATEKFTVNNLINMVVVVTGIGIASYGMALCPLSYLLLDVWRPALAYAGEIQFVLMGVILQVASIMTESVRLTLIQILLQKRGIKMNPVSTLYHISPACFVFLFLPFTYIELPKMMKDPDLNLNIPLLLGSAFIAFGEGIHNLGYKGSNRVRPFMISAIGIAFSSLFPISCSRTPWVSQLTDIQYSIKGPYCI
jgi:hypothetical protein